MSVRNPATSSSGAVSEAALFQQAQAGYQDSLNALMARHEGLVQAIVRRQVLGDLSFAEALHAGRIGLWHAIVGFDPSRGFAFSTYA
jgi:DNA-directed RNA polymerase sigma subunit (sigma70/sigma32)